MAEFNIDAMVGTYQDFARGYLFYCYFDNMPVSWNQDYTYLVRTTNLPESSIEEMTVSWQGFDYKLASTQTFADFTITFSTDTELGVRDSFVKWATMIHDPSTNQHGDPRDYMSAEITLQPLDRDGDEIGEYILHRCWVKSVGTATLDYTAKDVMTFDVTFSYLWHEFNV